MNAMNESRTRADAQRTIASSRERTSIGGFGVHPAQRWMLTFSKAKVITSGSTEFRERT